jgi:hypothetical protein
MECNAAELSSDGSLASFKMNLLVLIMQLVMLSEHISSWMAPMRSDRLDKFVNLNDCIRCQLVQLNSKLVQYVYEYQMGHHTEPSSKRTFKENSFIHTGLRQRLYARGSAISLRKVAHVVLHRPDMCLRNT